MSERVTMPALGESVTEGTVTRWLKNVGDTVEVDEPLLEVSTDKVDTEIPSPVAGTVQEILAQEDETVPVGAELAVIGDGAGPAGDAGAATPTESTESSGGGPASQPDAGSDQQTRPATEAPEPPAEAPSTEIEPEQEAKAPKAGTSPAGSRGSEGSDGSDGSDGAGTTVTMPALGESVTEGTITRWLKAEGDPVEVDEPLLEVSTDKVDTEIPSPVAGRLTSILAAEDETVPVGAALAVIGGTAGSSSATGEGTQPADKAVPAGDSAAPARASAAAAQPATAPAAAAAGAPAPAPSATGEGTQPADKAVPAGDSGAPARASAAAAQPATAPAAAAAGAPAPAPSASGTAKAVDVPQSSLPATAAPAAAERPAAAEEPTPAATPSPVGDAAAYVTPLVRKLAVENDVDLSALTGTGVGGRIRKQDVLDAAKALRTAQEQERETKRASASEGAPDQRGDGASGSGIPASARSVAVSPKRGTTEKMSRLRKVIAQRMVESLQVSAQLTTVVEVDLTKVGRLRERAKRDFEAREGVKLSFLPFLAQAAVEALKTHPNLNASVEGDSITYHGAEHLGIAVDTEKGLYVPVIRDAGDLNVAGLSRKIADLAERTRTNRILPDELGGGTFTLTNTGSRGALFDTPIINQPQVAILGTGAVVKRPVVVPDGEGGETIGIRSMIYLALSYDHRIVDGADAARFLATMKTRLEEGAFEASLGL